MTMVRVMVAIELDIGDETIDDDFWMEGLMLDLNQDLSQQSWYIDEAFELNEAESAIARNEIAKLHERLGMTR